MFCLSFLLTLHLLVAELFQVTFMASFFRRGPKQISAAAKHNCAHSRFQSLQRLQFQWRTCSTSTATNTNTTTSTTTSNAELLTQLQTMQKQLNALNKNTKKSKWKYFFGAIYFTPAFIVYYLIFSFWKSTKDEILEQKNAFKVININIIFVLTFLFG